MTVRSTWAATLAATALAATSGLSMAGSPAQAAGALATARTTSSTSSTPSAPSAPSAPRGWAATLTSAVHYTGTRLSATPRHQRVEVTVALKPRRSAAMQAAMKRMYTPGSASYQHFLTAAQWRSRYAPTAHSAGLVTRFLSHEGFTHVATPSSRLVVTAVGTAAEAEKAFHTRLSDFRLGKRRVFGNTRPALVPRALAGVVSAVIGLNDLKLDNVRPLTAKPTAGSPDVEGGLYPAQFDTTYDATGTATGSKTPIAILTEGATAGVIKDLRLAESKESATRVPYTVVKVGAQSKDTSGADEFDMDSQVSTIVAGTVKRLYLYNVGSLGDAQIDADFAYWAAQDKAKAMSASIGGCETNSYLDGSELATDEVMQEAAMQGQTLFASSGDNGDACMYVAALGAPAGVPGVNWPCSGEFTVCVGGTSLVTDDQGNRIQEIGWLGSGGGVSYLENPGWWTAATDVLSPAEYVTGGREVPDVALDGDPNVATPCLVYVGTSTEGVGGTSLSSPMMLGFWARIESARKNRLGLAAPLLYRVFDKVNPGTTVPGSPVPVTVPTEPPATVPGLTDIVVGPNGLYQTTPGYDMVTGLGAPDVKVLERVIGK